MATPEEDAEPRRCPNGKVQCAFGADLLDGKACKRCLADQVAASAEPQSPAKSAPKARRWSLTPGGRRWKCSEDVTLQVPENKLLPLEENVLFQEESSWADRTSLPVCKGRCAKCRFPGALSEEAAQARLAALEEAVETLYKTEDDFGGRWCWWSDCSTTRS